MPLNINVGLSRKASKDYQSTGYSINVTAELDQSLLARPEELQAQIGGLYAQAERALACQAGGDSQDRRAPPPVRQEPRVSARPGDNGNGRPHSRAVPATESQKRAIGAICRRLRTDPEYESQQLIGLPFLSLSVKQASELIDNLKTIEPADAGGNGGAR